MTSFCLGYIVILKFELYFGNAGNRLNQEPEYKYAIAFLDFLMFLFTNMCTTDGLLGGVHEAIRLNSIQKGIIIKTFMMVQQ